MSAQVIQLSTGKFGWEIFIFTQRNLKRQLQHTAGPPTQGVPKRFGAPPRPQPGSGERCWTFPLRNLVGGNQPTNPGYMTPENQQGMAPTREALQLMASQLPVPATGEVTSEATTDYTLSLYALAMTADTQCHEIRDTWSREAEIAQQQQQQALAAATASRQILFQMRERFRQAELLIQQQGDPNPRVPLSYVHDMFEKMYNKAEELAQLTTAVVTTAHEGTRAQQRLQQLDELMRAVKRSNEYHTATRLLMSHQLRPETPLPLLIHAQFSPEVEKPTSPRRTPAVAYAPPMTTEDIFANAARDFSTLTLPPSPAPSGQSSSDAIPLPTGVPPTFPPTQQSSTTSSAPQPFHYPTPTYNSSNLNFLLPHQQSATSQLPPTPVAKPAPQQVTGRHTSQPTVPTSTTTTVCVFGECPAATLYHSSFGARRTTTNNTG